MKITSLVLVDRLQDQSGTTLSNRKYLWKRACRAIFKNSSSASIIISADMIKASRLMMKRDGIL